MHAEISNKEDLIRELAIRKYLVGLKETKRAVKKNLVEYVIIAEDTQEKVTVPLLKLCKEVGVETIFIGTMVDLGMMVKLDVKASVIAILKEMTASDS